jgi:hypothetical protein
MTHISGFERSQLLLLPEAVDDYGGADNPMRFIDDFVDELDLAAAGFNHVEAKATGRPGYAPVDFLKLYIYGYLNRVRSRPQAGDETPPQLRGHLAAAKPKTGLQDHRRLPARQSRRIPISVPSVRTAVPAARPLWPRVAGRRRNPHQGGQQQGPETQNSLNKFIRAADQRLDDYLRRLDEGDVEEGGTGGGART